METFFTRKNLIIITIVIALLLIAGVLIYDPHPSPQSAAKSFYRSDVGCLMEYEDNNFYFKVFNSKTFSTAKKSLFFWKNDYLHPYDLDSRQRHVTKTDDAYYYYGKIGKPKVDNAESVALVSSALYSEPIKPAAVKVIDEYIFFVFRLDKPITQKKLVFTDSSGEYITENRNQNPSFILHDVNNPKDTQFTKYSFKKNDNPEFVASYNNLINEIITNGEVIRSSVVYELHYPFLETTPESIIYFKELHSKFYDITYFNPFSLYLYDGKVILKTEDICAVNNLSKTSIDFFIDQEYYEIENTGIIKEFVDMCAELYKKNASS